MRQSKRFYSILFQYMTRYNRYTIRMKILSLHQLLLSLGFQGMLWTVLLLLFCFGGVYITTLARLGWEYKNSPSDSPQEEKQAPAPKAQEPIYYIVERKRRLPKGDYDEPKQIHFKNG